MPFASGPFLQYLGAGKYATVGPTDYAGSDRVFHIPSDFPTDLASVPRIFWALLPPSGVYEKAAVVHDWFCVHLASGDCIVSARDADGIFRRIAREGGAGLLTRWALWTGVRWGALFNPHRRAGWLRDAPAVLGITAVGLVVTLLAVWGLDAIVHPLVGLL
jgi:hypothetical protein